jgi:copper transport protein
MHASLKFRYLKFVPLIVTMLFLFAGSMMVPQVALGHASLVQAVPEPNSQLTESPGAIAITFNEQLDEGLFYIKVFDQRGNQVTSNPTKLNAQKTGLELAIPKLPEGIYVVSYHVISADGHPVSGSYPLTIGNPPQSVAPTPVKSSPILQPHQHGGASSFSVSMAIQYLSRGLWYLSMLALAGWILWLRIPGAGGAGLRKELQFWTLNLQRIYLISILLVIFTHIEDLLGDEGIGQLGNFFTTTSIGLNWILLLAISLLGFIVLQRYAWLDFVWVAALLVVKSLNGHAITFSPKTVTVLLDIIHLGAASIWIGGLMLLAFRWKKEEAEISLFLKLFSNMALVSIFILTLSGAASVLLFLPNLQYLTYSTWGILLLIKIGIVVGVVVVAAILRFALKKHREQFAKRWFKIDFSLMLVIVVLVGFISYMAPIPSNEPLNWHVMGETVHMTADISPKVQGTNTFTAKVWLPEKAGKPKQVLMILTYMDDEQIAPIQVPLVPYEDTVKEESYGFVKYSYKAIGAYLPLRGHWALQVRVLDAEDNEKVYDNTFIVY